MNPNVHLVLYLSGVAAAEHSLLEYTFTSVQRCHMCQGLLLGLVRQGLQCRGGYLNRDENLLIII